MDLFVLVIVIPELLIILFSLIMVISSLAGCGDFARLIPDWKPPKKKVSSSYWGYYQAGMKESETAIALPKLLKVREQEHMEPDYN